MHRRALFLIIVSLFLLKGECVLAQSSDSARTIQGKVVDEKHNPIYGAIVSLHKSDSTIAGTSTDEFGSFAFRITTQDLYDSVRLRIAYTSYRPDTILLTQHSGFFEHVVRMEPQPEWEVEEILIVCICKPPKPKKAKSPKNKPALEVATATYYCPNPPLIDPYEPNKRIITSEEIKQMGH